MSKQTIVYANTVGIALPKGIGKDVAYKIVGDDSYVVVYCKFGRKWEPMSDISAKCIKDALDYIQDWARKNNQSESKQSQESAPSNLSIEEKVDANTEHIDLPETVNTEHIDLPETVNTEHIDLPETVNSKCATEKSVELEPLDVTLHQYMQGEQFERQLYSVTGPFHIEYGNDGTQLVDCAVYAQYAKTLASELTRFEAIRKKSENLFWSYCTVIRTNLTDIYDSLAPDHRFLNYHDFSSYIIARIMRTVRHQKNPVINTGLVDYENKIIYIVYTESIDNEFSTTCINPRKIYRVNTLEEARELCPGTIIDRFPEVVPWARYADNLHIDLSYSLEAPDEFTVEHICKDRLHRLYCNGGNFSIESLESILCAEVNYAKQRLKHDLQYAIPIYSVTHDIINFIIPMYDNPERTGLPQAVISLRRFIASKTYRVNTVLTITQAYKACFSLVDPEKTWLAGTYDKFSTKGYTIAYPDPIA